MVVSAAGSTDPDGDSLTFTWSEGATTLAVSSVPSATVGLPVGAHTLTLTVSDGFGGVATATTHVTVVDATAGLQAQIASLTAQLAAKTQQLTLAQQQLATAQQQLSARSRSSPTAAGDSEQLRWTFHDPSFTVPGAAGAQLQAIVQAVLGLGNDRRGSYDTLNPHHGHDHDRSLTTTATITTAGARATGAGRPSLTRKAGRAVMAPPARRRSDLT